MRQRDKKNQQESMQEARRRAGVETATETERVGAES